MCIFCVLRPQPRCSWTSNRRKQYLRTMNGINDVNGPNGQQHYKPLEAQSIAQRQQEVWNVCRALKDRNELYGVLTRNSAIAMWGVPDPSMDSARTADGVPWFMSWYRPRETAEKVFREWSRMYGKGCPKNISVIRKTASTCLLQSRHGLQWRKR